MVRKIRLRILGLIITPATTDGRIWNAFQMKRVSFASEARKSETIPMKLTGNKILITGGASGIGYAMAERFVAEGNTVLICGRREDALDAAKERLPSIITRQCDLASEA